MEWLSSKVPESCLLILLGTILGAILKYTSLGNDGMMTSLQPKTFFLFLLPPIILESAFSLHDQVFFDNLGTILLYAVIGTLINWIVIGAGLYGLNIAGAMGGGFGLGFIPSLVFSALIVAVDPVAVLAIFQEFGVNNVLYFLVFGESLLNDAVTVVIYNTMNTMNKMESIGADQVVLAVVAFFTISLGGLAIGILYGIFTCLVTRHTQKVKVVEPLAVLTFAYASYLTAELFHFSGIISIIGCGLMQAQYAFHNIGQKSLTTIKYFSKMLSATCDCIIFMFLGISVVSANHQWNTGFILWSLCLCMLVRFLVVFCLTFIANKWRLRKIDYEEQFIMAYGGLRGAIAFCLVAMLDMKEQNLFETATIVVILFTVFIQGITIKPFVKLLRIKTAGHKSSSIYIELNNHVVDHVVAGIEEIVGHIGHNALREYFNYYDEKYFKVWFQRDPQTSDDYIMQVYQELTIKQHYRALESGKRYRESQILSSKSDVGEDTQLGTFEKTPGQQISFEKYMSIDSTDPNISHRSLDIGKARRRSQSKRKSIHQSPDSSGDAFQRSLSEPEAESGRRNMKKQGSLSRVFSRGAYDSKETIADPTAEDFRRWVVKPVREEMRQKHDKNLIYDEQNDIVHHLDQKRKRLHRLITAKSMYESIPSVFDHPGSRPRARTGPNMSSENLMHVASLSTSLPNTAEIEMQEMPSKYLKKSNPRHPGADPNQNDRTPNIPAPISEESEESAALLEDSTTYANRCKLVRQVAQDN